MSEPREAIVNAATERVVDAARKPLGRRPVDVSRGATLYADAVAAIGSVALVGECRAAQTSFDRRTAWFDLADPNGQWTSMLVLPPERKRIEGFLGMDLLEFLTEGKVLAVSGRFVPGRRSGERQLRVEKISATAVEDAGAAFLARTEAQSFLESAFAQDPEQYGDRDATRPYRGRAKDLAQQLSNRGSVWSGSSHCGRPAPRPRTSSPGVRPSGAPGGAAIGAVRPDWSLRGARRDRAGRRCHRGDPSGRRTLE